MIQRLGMIAGGILAVWIVLLLVLGVVFGERKARAIAERVGEALQATATIEDHDLALVRGHLHLDQLRVQRDDRIGRLMLDVAGIRCDLGAFGIAIFDSSCRELAISNLRLELSTFALFKLQRPKRPPIRADAVTLENATLVFSPAAVAPSLGRIELTIEHATAGPTVLATPLSWVFHLESLRATLELPVGKIALVVANGTLSAQGSVFGSRPVTIPFAPPTPEPGGEPQAEITRLVTLGKDLATRLVEQRARDWLHRR